MAITESYANTQSVGTTEHSLPNDATYSSGSPITADGLYQVFIDANAVAAADLFRFRIYEKVQSTDTQRIVYEAYIGGPQMTPVWVSPALALIHGWDVTLTKISGTDRTITWSIRNMA